jgi:F-type H+-transporting ATPase subunit b
MLIDWFTIGAQALNFTILVWLLKRFLYKPVLDAIDARESRIAKKVQAAQAAQDDAQAQLTAFNRKSEEFDHARAELLAQASQAANLERDRLVAAAQKTADELGAKLRTALQTEASQLNRDLYERIQHSVFAIARKTLSDLATTSLEERITEVFIQRLQTIDPAERATLTAAIPTQESKVVIHSAFELSEALQSTIQLAVDGCFGNAVELRFETNSALVCGIEMMVGGQKLSWTVTHHIDELEQLASTLVVSSVDALASAETTHTQPVTNAT